MTTWISALSCCLLTFTSLLLAEEPERPVRMVSLEGVIVAAEFGRAERPLELTGDVFAAAIPNAAHRELLAGRADPATHTLLLFHWQGSGQDRISPEVVEADGNKSVVFHYERGRTRDLRQHTHLFAVSRELNWKVK